MSGGGEGGRLDNQAEAVLAVISDCRVAERLSTGQAGEGLGEDNRPEGGHGQGPGGVPGEFPGTGLEVTETIPHGYEVSLASSFLTFTLQVKGVSTEMDVAKGLSERGEAGSVTDVFPEPSSHRPVLAPDCSVQVRQEEGEGGERYYVNMFTGLAWYTARDRGGRVYYYEENGNESCWSLPNVGLSIQDHSLAASPLPDKAQQVAWEQTTNNFGVIKRV